MRLCANDDTITAFLRVYDAIPPRDRESLSWEAIALKAELDLRSFLGSAILALREHSASKVKLLALSRHPDVVQARIEAALLPGGHRDRDSFDTAMGFLPTAKPSTFIGKQINAVVQDPAQMPRTEDPSEEEDDLDQLFPSASSTQEKLVNIRRRMLESGS